MYIQQQILVFFESIRNDFLTLFFTTITIMAEKVFLLLILATLYWCVDKTASKKLGWFVLFNGTANNVIKNIVNMPRPFDLGVVKPIRVETATGSSFPSGHTQSATSFWMGSMMILRTKASILIGSVLIVLTAVSRLYLGAHWPMDVAGAILFGFIFTYLASQLIDEEGTMSQNHVIGTSLVCLVVLVLNVHSDLYNAVAALWGFVIGSYIEQKYIKFEVKGRLRTLLIRLAIGIAGTLIIYVGMSKALPDIKSISMLKNTSVTLWIMAGAPYFFKWIKEK